MAEKLNLDAVMNEPRQIIMTLEGRKSILPFLSTKTKQIIVDIPNLSIRQAQKLRQQYYTFVYAYVRKDEKSLAMISMDIMVKIFRPYHPWFTKHWILHRFNNDAFSKILDFIFQPTKEREEELLKNAIALQKSQS
jgi:hypothetical protein